MVANGSGSHGAYIVQALLWTLNAAGASGDNVRVMYVIGPASGSQVAAYVKMQKDAGVNIVAVADSFAFGGTFSRADAEFLESEDILLFVPGGSNTNVNRDSSPGGPIARSFFHATPRGANGTAPLDTIIPVTTRPALAQTEHGINSFHFAVPGVTEQSYAVPVAAAYAAIVYEAYVENPAHAGLPPPTAAQLKRAMMTGVDYEYDEEPEQDQPTVTHEFLNNARAGMRVLNLSKINTALADTSPGITDVSMTPTPLNDLGNSFELAVSGAAPTADPRSNWTISYGDNSFSDQSGVEVIPGTVTSIEHTFPITGNLPFSYFPTIYAMSNSRRVFLQSTQAQVTINKFAPTSGKDDYTLSRSGNNLVLTLQNTATTSFSIPASLMPTCYIVLGQGGDTLTIDFSGGDPYELTNLSFAGGPTTKLYLRGSSANDFFDATRDFVSINSRGIGVSNGLPVHPITGGGSDTLRVSGKDREDGVVYFDSPQTFASIHIDTFGKIVISSNGDRVLRTGSLTLGPIEEEERWSLDLNDSNRIVDYTGTSPLSQVVGWIASARKDGAWTGNGITSTAAKDDPLDITMLGVTESADYIAANSTSTFSGQTIDNTSVLVKYTYYGDAQLTGAVDFDDYAQIDNASIDDPAPTPGWFNGDFDLSNDARPDFDGYFLIDNAFLLQGNALRGGPTPAQLLAQTEHFTTAYMYEFIAYMATRGVTLTPEDFFPATGRGGVPGDPPAPRASRGSMGVMMRPTP
jgi:hypothetical protein